MLNARIKKTFPSDSKKDSRAEADSHGGESDGDFVLDVEFAAPPGVTILFGASGSGKTQTLLSVAGLTRPDEGLIAVEGETLFDSSRGFSLPVSRRRVGYVFQSLALFPHMTAQANVEFAAHDLPKRERRERASALLERFGVGHTAARRPREISGGEAQRVALARALASEPRMLLLDEPLSALDEPVKLSIMSDLREMNRRLRLPILYVTHSRDEALALGERALVFERGRIIAAGEPHEVFGSPASLGVARLAGVENIFEGVVKGRNESAGTMVVRLFNTEGVASYNVEVPLGRAVVGSRVTVAVRSGDVLLATAEPRGLSARNVLRGRVSGIERRSSETLVRVECGGVTWAASVTRQSLEELSVEVGREVWLAFKTYSCRIFDGE
ncbi:MAG TPA: molybdenum ABC transporter ATP-binding protein [Pyrinomonadaceae bacterium]|jgi:molybdate transport system ATP-binding protein|nr:molybdenum ABC transporter ATP-binding protein [Pyrinomonadaceae bacterium]